MQSLGPFRWADGKPAKIGGLLNVSVDGALGTCRHQYREQRGLGDFSYCEEQTLTVFIPVSASVLVL